VPFHQILDSIDVDKPAAEDPAKNPEGDTFYYIGLLVEALNRLGRLQNAVDTLKQRLPVELFTIVNETTTEVDNRHLKTLRNRSSPSLVKRETKLQAEVIYDLLWTLYAKFEAIAEGQRVLHESVKALIRREGAGNNSALLGSFKELWHLYQNEIRSLLHNYVTTDSDVYHFARSPHNGSSFGGGDYSREHLFKLSEADAKAPEMMIEMDALEGIIRSAVPGLTGASRKGLKHLGGNNSGQRKTPFSDPSDHNQPSRKSLVEPSVFNMSLLLPPTLTFLQRLKTIVPPGSDLATSTLTTFLDNFLVNVFQPQLDETLGKLSDSIFGEPDSFLQDQEWRRVAKRPVLKGTTAFFDVVTAFCRMLGTIPHDQALSSLILTQMNRYYERCLGWYKALVSRTNESDAPQLRVSAQMALESGEMQDVMNQLLNAGSSDASLLDKEVDMLVAFANSAKMGDGKSQNMDMVSSLCLLYTSLNWLRFKISGLRHITHQEADSSRPMTPRAPTRRWTLMNDPAKLASDNQPVILPMTHETVQTFDTIVTSYEDLAVTALLTLHMEARCQIAYSLSVALSPETAPYLLDQEVSEPDPQILSLNSDLIAYDEIVSRFLPAPEVTFVRTGLGRLVNTFLVSNASRASPMNIRGCHRMHLNILVLQQNLKNIEDGVALTRATEYYSLFEKGPDAIVEKAKAGGAGGGGEGEVRFSYDELKALLDLFYSEPLANPERGIASAAKRQLDDKSLSLNEIMWS
jgi:exocyst complex component 4